MNVQFSILPMKRNETGLIAKKNLLALACLAMALNAGGDARAAITVSQGLLPGGTAVVTAGDLLETSFASSTPSDGTAGIFGSTLASLRNGLLNPSNFLTTNGSYSASGSFTIEYFLDTTVNTLGYDLTSIVTTTDLNDPRHGQFYTVDVRPVGGAFAPLAGAVASLADSGATEYHSGQVTIADSVLGVSIASGVDAIRFNITSTSGSEDVYREIDIIGSATTSAATSPEPSTLVLAGFSLLSLGFYRRRSRAMN